jgi:hypothetical protein
MAPLSRSGYDQFISKPGAWLTRAVGRGMAKALAIRHEHVFVGPPSGPTVRSTGVRDTGEAGQSRHVNDPLWPLYTLTCVSDVDYLGTEILEGHPAVRVSARVDLLACGSQLPREVGSDVQAGRLDRTMRALAWYDALGRLLVLSTTSTAPATRLWQTLELDSPSVYAPY